MTPMRIQRRRTRGWRMPANTVYVARPSRYGNGYIVTEVQTATQAVDRYRLLLTNVDSSEARRNPAWRFAILDSLPTLRGRNLACWCKLCPAHKDGKPLDVDCLDCAPCHVDVLGRLANAKPQG